MKKIIGVILTVLLICTMLAGCHGEGEKAFASKRFEVIEVKDTFMDYTEMYLYDRETGVMYLWVTGGYAAGLTPLYNADGTLMIYEG